MERKNIKSTTSESNLNPKQKHSKRAYQKPRLIKHGDIDEITRLLDGDGGDGFLGPKSG